MDFIINFIPYLVGSIIMGIITQLIGKSKGYRYCWAWGFFLGLLGLIIVICCSGKNKVDFETNNKYDNLEKLQKLKENGTISQKEFEKEKNKLLK